MDDRFRKLVGLLKSNCGYGMVGRLSTQLPNHGIRGPTGGIGIRRKSSFRVDGSFNFRTSKSLG
jgi:hypothetical protein